jgi:NTE family protein
MRRTGIVSARQYSVSAAEPGAETRAVSLTARAGSLMLALRQSIPEYNMRTRHSLWLAIGVISLLAANAAESQQAPAAERPRIGLVLGGGGAKGGAHIGVLEVLDELRVPVDCVVGTSMGALVGATFASGTSPAEIERRVRAINWDETVGGVGRRNRMPIERKLSPAPYTNSLEFGIDEGEFRTPSGLVATQSIEDTIRLLVPGTRDTESFDDLGLPFRAVATDIVASEMVVLDGGDLPVAMRASMAIPGVFSPVVDGDRVMVDGGLMRNIPVDVARDLCADVVIAIWFPEPDPGPMKDLSPVAAMYRSLLAMVLANENEQIESLTGDDVNLPVTVGDLGAADFDRVPEAIELGRAAANAARESLQRYALPEADFRAWRAAIEAPPDRSNVLAEVRFTGLDRVNAEYLRTQLRTTVPGASVDNAQIAAEAERLYALGDFDKIDYRLSGPESARVLEFQPVEKPWGPDILQFDFGLSSTGDGALHGNLRADHTRTWLNSRGGRWHNTLQFGRQSLVSSDFYQPFDKAQRYFVQPKVAFERYIEDFYLGTDRIADYTLQEGYAQIDVGANLSTRAQFRLGVRSGRVEAKVRTGQPGLPEANWLTDTRVDARFVYDSRDVITLPTRGVFVNLRYLDSQDWFGGEQDYRIAEGLIAPAFDIDGDSLSLILGGGALLSGDLPLNEQIEVGGLRTFPGLRPGELRGNDYWFAGARYLKRLTDLAPVFGQSVYAGVRLQAGEMKSDGVLADSGTLYGISGSLTGLTPLGPFLLSLGYVVDRSVRLQFAIGRPVREGSILDTLN